MTAGCCVLPGGYTRRANSISPLFPGSKDVAAKIAWCEEQYAAQGLPTVFKLMATAQQTGLDTILEQQGYSLEDESQVWSAPLAELRIDKPGPHAVILPVEEWFSHYAAITGQPTETQHWHRQILQAIVPAICPMAIMRDGRPAAVGLGVLERGMVGLYDVVTDKSYRRQGIATQLISAIVSWAATHGAHGTYLQVMPGNMPAQTLYAKLGYRLCYQYWYRVKQSMADTQG
ncbi:MAG TPA: GNAT family N-acetyltransferase [Armatimonadota bacterium]|nr:GNAT family N-acetyltransferase [Armatimonadota bacterium]